jgi:hypothetical protein
VEETPAIARPAVTDVRVEETLAIARPQVEE